jgi:hypothetical protein
MSEKVFFISHAAPHDGDAQKRRALDRFFGDLENAVRELAPVRRGARVGFWDVRDIPAGSVDFSANLRGGLDAHPIGLVLLDPAYLSNDRPYCRWEFESLEARNRWASEQGGDPPQLLFVVDWIKVDPADEPREFPRLLQRVREQIADDRDDILAVRAVVDRGLKPCIDLVLSEEAGAIAGYTRFVRCLARQIDAQRRKIPAAAWSPPRAEPFDESLVWSRPPMHAAVEPGPGRAVDRKKIIYAVVAGRPDDIRPVCQDRMWRYELDGHEDWRPFATDDQRAGNPPRLLDLLQAMQASGRLAGEVRGYPFSRHLAEDLAVLEGKYPVILFVDPWTITHLEPYRLLSEQLFGPGAEAPDASVIIIWNDLDPDVAPNRFTYEQAVNQVFSGNTRAASHAEVLTQVFHEAVERRRSQIRSSTTARLPRPGSPKPSLSATP